jgi:hypothetical protein
MPDEHRRLATEVKSIIFMIGRNLERYEEAQRAAGDQLAGYADIESAVREYCGQEKEPAEELIEKVRKANQPPDTPRTEAGGFDELEEALERELGAVLNEVAEASEREWLAKSSQNFSGDAFNRALRHFSAALAAADEQAMGRAMQAMSAGLQQWSLAMQQGRGPSGSDQRCAEARLQVKEYDRVIRATNPSHSVQHRQARELYTRGRQGNQEWIDAHC